jgi:negative regulator of sigma E activity
MTCDTLYPKLSALLDGELTSETAAEAERHLAACPECVQAQADRVKLREMADAWTVDAPDIAGRVMQAIAFDDQSLLLTEMQRLRAEMQELRGDMAALRRQLPGRTPLPLWTPPARPDDPKMENDPWSLIRF